MHRLQLLTAHNKFQKLKNGERKKCVGRWNYIQYEDRIDLKSDSVAVDVKTPQLKTGTQIGNTKSGIRHLTTCFWQSEVVENLICLTVPLSAVWEVFVSLKNTQLQVKVLLVFKSKYVSVMSKIYIDIW